MKKVFLLLPILIGTAWSASENTQSPEFIENLIRQMTVQEKVGQLNLVNDFSNDLKLTGPQAQGKANPALTNLRNGEIGAMLNAGGVTRIRELQKIAVEESRLKIPLLFGLDVIHGYQTMFPIPLAEAASWDLAAIERSARLAAIEATAAGVHWTYAPMVDICRDPRWGRIMEGAGEDPYLGAKIAAARVRGFQGKSMQDPESLAACAKHYAGYGFAEAGRDYNTVDVSGATLHNVILPPFHAAADAGVATFMSSFNDLNGVPAVANRDLQQTILRETWGWRGMMVTDWNAIRELMAHGFAFTPREAAQLAFTGGADMDMCSRLFSEELEPLLENKKILVKELDEKVRRVLRLKQDLGLFRDPYRGISPEREKSKIGTPESRQSSRNIALKSAVLLKNSGILPFSTNLKSLAVIGPLADDHNSPLGNWRAEAIPNSAVSLLEGLRTALPKTEIFYAEGCPLIIGEANPLQNLKLAGDVRTGFPEAIAAAQKADAVVLCIGEHGFMTGEGRSRTSLGLPGAQNALAEAVLQANPRTVVIVMTGRPLILTDLDAKFPAILLGWHLGSEAGHALADLLLGKISPSGRLPVSFPRSLGQIPIYHNRKNTGRPANGDDALFVSRYTDCPNDPLYRFGYGLSYSRFTLSDPTVSPTNLSVGKPAQVTLTLKNDGKVPAAEVVQLYLHDLAASLTPQVEKLIGFARVELSPGKSKTLTFLLTDQELGFYDNAGKFLIEPGTFEIFARTGTESTPRVSLTLK